MSSSYTFSSSSSSSSSAFSSRTSTNRNGKSTGHTYTTEQRSGPQGTTVRTTTQNRNEPAVEETHYYDASGREVPADMDGIRERRTLEGAGASGSAGGSARPRRMEDVHVSGEDAEIDRMYRERMEDEYAKREGGA